MVRTLADIAVPLSFLVDELDAIRDQSSWFIVWIAALVSPDSELLQHGSRVDPRVIN